MTMTMTLWHWLMCKLDRHEWGKPERMAFYQEILDIRSCVHCKVQEPFIIGWNGDFLRQWRK